METLHHFHPRIPGLMIFMFILVTSIGAEGLSEPYQLSKGEVAALQLNFYAQAVWKTNSELYDAPFFAVYDKTEEKIILNIYGAQDKIGMAQTTIGNIPYNLKNNYIPYIKNLYGIELKLSDIRIVYRDRRDEQATVILTWENGEYKFPNK